MLSERLQKAYDRLQAKRMAMDALEVKAKVPPLRYIEMCSKSETYIGRVEGKPLLRASRPGAVGLRMLACVTPEFRGHTWHWQLHTRDAYTGWYLNNNGWSSRDGDGLCWGVVVQISGSKWRTRLFPGYMLGNDNGVTIDLSSMVEIQGVQSVRDLFELDDVIQLARRADCMAKDLAEEEREYQTQQEENDVI